MRLIDADALVQELGKICVPTTSEFFIVSQCTRKVKDAPTIDIKTDEEFDALKAQAKELKYILDQNNDERSKIGIMFEEALKENEDLKKKIEYLSGQCEAYKYCISKMGGDDNG